MGDLVSFILPFLVVCVQVWSSGLAVSLSRSADTELGALINKPKQKLENKRQRPQKTFLTCFPNGKNTLQCLQLLEQVKECLRHNDLENYLCCWIGGSNDNGFTNVILLFKYRSFWGDKMTLQHLIIDNAAIWCRDERKGNEKSLDLKIPLVVSSPKCNKKQKRFNQVSKLTIFVITIWCIFIPGHYLNSDHHFSLLVSQRFYLSMCSHDKHTP